MTDGEILEMIEKGELVIEDFLDSNLEPASYDMRLGKRGIVSHLEKQIDIERERGITINPGEFALLTTLEKVKLSDTVAAHIGLRSYYARKGLVLLSGPQVDPGFEGILVIGVCNLSPRKITIDYEDRFCTVEFHKLSRAVKRLYPGIEEQAKGEIPKVDKDYLRTLEVESLSEMSESIRQLSSSVGTLTTIVYKVILPIITATFVAVVVGFLKLIIF
ncbi:MAG: dCTP deaminase [Methanocellales archaeon]|nr:dCTP deaminase [Methanocellales archaeon]